MMILLTFPPVAPGETVIRAKGIGVDVTVGHCWRIGNSWNATLYAMANHPGAKVGDITRPTLAELKNAVRGRLERSGKWWSR